MRQHRGMRVWYYQISRPWCFWSDMGNLIIKMHDDERSGVRTLSWGRLQDLFFCLTPRQHEAGTQETPEHTVHAVDTTLARVRMCESCISP